MRGQIGRNSNHRRGGMMEEEDRGVRMKGIVLSLQQHQCAKMGRVGHQQGQPRASGD